MTNSLSYYVANVMKLYNEDGTEKTLKEHDMQFLKMVAKAWELGCDLKLVKFKDKCVWILEGVKEQEFTTTPEFKEKADDFMDNIWRYVFDKAINQTPKEQEEVSVLDKQWFWFEKAALNEQQTNTFMQIATPIHDRLLVKPEEAPEKVGEWDIPDDAQKKPKRGTVITVGPGKHADETGVLIPMQCKVGDTVLYSKFGGTEIDLDGVQYVILKETECLAIL